MTTTEDWLEIYRMAHTQGFTAIRRTIELVEIRPPLFEPGDDVYILNPSQARTFLEGMKDDPVGH